MEAGSRRKGDAQKVACGIPSAGGSRLSMAGEGYVIMTVECTHCKTKQKVHVKARPGFAQMSDMSDQSMQCIECNQHFVVMLPDKIVAGPFPV
jgi:hypothetical protein